MDCICKRCGYKTERLYNLKLHFQRKKTCEDKEGCGKSCQELMNDIALDTSKYEFGCEICKQKFRTRQGRWRHMKECIGNETEHELLRQENKRLKEENEILKNGLSHSYIDNSVNTTINNNITIVLKDFGTEDITYVKDDKKFLDACLKELSTAIRNVVEKIYFDDNHPENRTILMRNRKLNQVMVRDHGEWKLRHVCETIPKMVTKSQRLLHKHYLSSDEGIQKETHDLEQDHKSVYLNDLLIPQTKVHKNAVSMVKAAVGNYKY